MWHAAFLGAPGSGKTTMALGIVEQLLLQGIPVILVDRKGDLCLYARPNGITRGAPGAAGRSNGPAASRCRDRPLYPAAIRRAAAIDCCRSRRPRGTCLTERQQPPGLPRPPSPA